MNSSLFKIVFSKRLGMLVAVGEHASSQGKANGNSGAPGIGAARTAGTFFLGVLGLCFGLTSWAWAQGVASTALPTGGAVSAGAAAISSVGAAMTIQQSSQRAAINWQSFNIGKDASVTVQQPNSTSVLLNRIGGDSPSQILGRMSANGQIVLVNPYGMTFGKDGSVSAAGFTASTLGISDADFMAGNMKFSRNGATGSIVNQGRLAAAPGGYVALLGASVSNEGTITTPQGATHLVAAETVKMPITETGRIKFELTPSAINAAVANQLGGAIVAEGGQVFLQASAANGAIASVMHSGGIDTSGAQAGNVTLLAEGGNIKVDGRITANSSQANQTGGRIVIGRDEDTGALAKNTDVSGATLESQRGFIETSGKYLQFDNTLVKADQWLLDPYDITIGATEASTINTNLNTGTSVTLTTSTDLNGTGNNAAGGNITVNSAINRNNNGASLTLTADNNIVLNADVSSSNGAMAVTLNAAGISSTSAGTINTNGGVLTLNTSNASPTDAMAGVISGSGSVTKSGTGKVLLTGTNTYTGGTTISSGTLQIEGAGAVGSGAIANNANLVFNNITGSSTTKDAYGTNALRLTQNITNADGATVTKTGTGSVILYSQQLKASGATYGADYLVDGGVLQVSGVDPANGILFYAKSVTVNNAKFAANGGLTTTDFFHFNTATINLNNGGIFDIRNSNFQPSSALTINATGAGNQLTQAGGAFNITNIPNSPVGAGVTLNTSSASDSLTVNVGILNNGDASLTKNGLGTVYLSAADTSNLWGGKTYVTGGLLQVGVGSTGGYINNNEVVLSNNATIAFNHSNNITVSNLISGTGNVSQAGTGTTTLTNNNTYNGTTTITSGTLQVGNGSTTGSLGTGPVVNSTSLIFNRSNALTQSGAISGTGTLTQAGTGTTTLTGNNTYSGTTTISAGALQVGNGGTSGTLGTGAVVDNGSLVFNRSDATTQSGAISGTGTLTQAGTGTTTLTGSNTYSGTTTISAGALQVGDGGTIGTLGTGAVVNNANLIFNRSDTVTESVAISGTGTLTQAGTGTTILTANNTYSGVTSVNAGTLQIGNAGSTGTLGSGNVTLSNNANLSYVRGAATSIANNISGSGNVIANITGTNSDLTLSNPINLTSGTVNLNASGAIISAADSAQITATNAYLTAGGTIGSITNHVQTQVANLYTNSGGSQFITEADSVTFAGKATASGGNVDLQVTNGALVVGSVNGQNGISTLADVKLSSTNNALDGNAIIVNQAISSTNGQVIITGNKTGTNSDPGYLNAGIQNNSNITASGNIIITATKQEQGLSTAPMTGYGYIGSGSVSSSNGSISITGSTDSGGGFWTNGGRFTAANGVSITGNSANSQGLYLANSTVQTTNGLLDLTGQNTSGGANGAIIFDGNANITNTNGGGINIVANKGHIQSGTGNSPTGNTITNGAANNTTGTGAISITTKANDATDTGYFDGTKLTVNQYASGGVSVKTSGTGNLTIAQINNYDTGDVSLAAGSSIAAGIATAGNVIAASGNKVNQSSTGKTLIYTGTANGTSAISSLVNGFSTDLRLADLDASNKQNTKSNSTYGATISGTNETTQVYFREKINLGATLNTAATYGDALTGTDIQTLLANSNTGVQSKSDTAGTFKINKASLIDALDTTSLGASNSFTNHYSASNHLNANTSGYTLDTVTTDYTGITGTLVVNKKDAIVTAASATKEYNGATKSVSTFSATGLISGESESVLTGVSVTGSGKNVGSYTTKASGTDSNYNLTFKDGTLDITKNTTANVVVTANSGSAVYNGTTQSVTGLASAANLVGDDTVDNIGVTASTSGKNAGTYTATVFGNKTALESNYANVTYNSGQLDITKNTTANSGNAVYNGTTQSVTGLTSATGLVGDDTVGNIGVTASTSGKNAGTYTNTVFGNKTALENNYANVTYNNGQLDIARNTTANVVLTAISDAKQYNSNMQSVSGFTVQGSLIADDTAGISASASGKNAGTYATSFSGTSQLEANYANVQKVNGALTITPAPLTIAAAAKQTTYNGKQQEQDAASVQGLKGSDVITVSGLANGTNPGTYMSSLRWSGLNAGNYAVTVVNAPLVILNAPPLLPSYNRESTQKTDPLTRITLLGFRSGSTGGATAVLDKLNLATASPNTCSATSLELCDCQTEDAAQGPLICEPIKA